ncbi:MAG: hypothetical protein EZS28_050150, partial [Streblomastix strix]
KADITTGTTAKGGFQCVYRNGRGGGIKQNGSIGEYEKGQLEEQEIIEHGREFVGRVNGNGVCIGRPKDGSEDYDILGLNDIGVDYYYYYYYGMGDKHYNYKEDCYYKDYIYKEDCQYQFVFIGYESDNDKEDQDNDNEFKLEFEFNGVIKVECGENGQFYGVY